GWIGDYLDPNTFLDMWITNGGNNQTGYSSPLYDQLYRAAKDVAAFCADPDETVYAKVVEGEELRRRVEAVRAAPETDRKKRIELGQRVRYLMFKEMERLVCEIDCAIMPIYFYVTTNLVKPHVGGFYAYLERGEKRIPNVRDLHPLRGFFIKRGVHP
ncbi:MAG: hypothetical protein ACE5JG_11270, partial [Planctomycetota bacterium]